MKPPVIILLGRKMRAKNHLDASWYANAPIIIAEGGGFKLTAREPDDRPVLSRAFNVVA
jgi:hypothetical protein